MLHRVEMRPQGASYGSQTPGTGMNGCEAENPTARPHSLLLQIFLSFPRVSTTTIVSFQTSAIIKAPVFADITTLIHHPGSKLLMMSLIYWCLTSATLLLQRHVGRHRATSSGQVLVSSVTGARALGTRCQSSFVRRCHDLHRVRMRPSLFCLF